MHDYAAPRKTPPRSAIGTAFVASLLAISIACLGGSFAVSSGDIGLPLFLVAGVASLATVLPLLVFAKRIPTALAVTGWTFVVLAALALGALFIGSLLIAGHLRTP
jgi:hypothetical protein